MWHAKKFGALGIGFKQFYLFNRGGGPVFYVTREGEFHHFFTKSENKVGCTNTTLDYANDEKYSFFENMSSPKRNDQGYVPYDLYEEAEWRVVFSEETEKNNLN